MIALDTNVLVRLLVEDDEGQAEAARGVVRAATEDGVEVLLPQIVLCEFVWVLEGAYGASKEEIVAALEGLSRTRPFVVQDGGLVRRALDRYAEGRGDFADYLLAAVAAESGAETVCTFDRALRDEAGFSRLS